MVNTKGFHFMKKIRTLSFGIVIAAGMAMFGTGIATADEVPPAATDPATGDEATTGSADSLAAILKALTTGSAAAEDPADTDPGTGTGTEVADETDPGTGGTGDEASTGSADSLAAILKALTTGSAAEEEVVETPPAS
ncbi:hypothetical protein ATK86_3263 [Nocardia fluminea]|uniref:Secreted protein n=2 Tax=Nocardia fluminea TaxID=134984 RepID=A0A2N3VB78_9NOCA|nr:hypothetical protein ATK86_3263 [Nocardia fluminea]